MAERQDCAVAIIGAGIVGIAVGYYLATRHGIGRIVIVDPRDPMSLTSSKSGENYRNWWPHPVMTAFTDHSISLMEEVAAATGNRIAMTRRGYALVTRRARPADLLDDLDVGYRDQGPGAVRIHETSSSSYRPATGRGWEEEPAGVDVLLDRTLIRKTFPTYADDVATVLHIRRAGSISGQQLGQVMLDTIKAKGGRLLRGTLKSVAPGSPFLLSVDTGGTETSLRAEQVVNAAGPALADVCELLGEGLPVQSVYQQKIAFEDREGAIARTMPFTIDLDGQSLPWTEDERAVLAEDPETARLLTPLPGGIHCRPEGAEQGTWIKLGWAFNETASDPHGPEPANPHFPDIVLRAASRLHPGLQGYWGRLPRGMVHYGGYYTMTPENWPLIGPLRRPGAFIAGALSGYGTMAACATGALCAASMAGESLPDYARGLGLARYDDPQLMASLAAQTSRGIL